MLPATARLHVDAAYDVETPQTLARLIRSVEAVLISTSSPLFAKAKDQTVSGIAAAFAACKPKYVILKQNRGGTELLDCSNAAYCVEALPAQLGTTINSVGVGCTGCGDCVRVCPGDAITLGAARTAVHHDG